MSLNHRTAILRVLAALLALGFGAGLQSNDRQLQFVVLPHLPQPVSNNAVALLADGQGFELYSALGLEPGKTWRDTSSKTFHYSSRSGRWERLQPVPGPGGRLAASAVAVAGQVYVFGGYTVSEDGSESSTPSVHVLENETGQWRRFSAYMLIPLVTWIAKAVVQRIIRMAVE